MIRKSNYLLLSVRQVNFQTKFHNRVMKIGSRPESLSFGGLLDMESNVQEIVRGPDGWLRVIGGWNRLRTDKLKAACLESRALEPSLSSKAGLYKFRFEVELDGEAIAHGELSTYVMPLET